MLSACADPGELPEVGNPPPVNSIPFLADELVVGYEGTGAVEVVFQFESADGVEFDISAGRIDAEGRLSLEPGKPPAAALGLLRESVPHDVDVTVSVPDALAALVVKILAGDDGAIHITDGVRSASHDGVTEDISIVYVDRDARIAYDFVDDSGVRVVADVQYRAGWNVRAGAWEEGGAYRITVRSPQQFIWHWVGLTDEADQEEPSGDQPGGDDPGDELDPEAPGDEEPGDDRPDGEEPVFEIRAFIEDYDFGNRDIIVTYFDADWNEVEVIGGAITSDGWMVLSPPDPPEEAKLPIEDAFPNDEYGPVTFSDPTVPFAFPGHISIRHGGPLEVGSRRDAAFYDVELGDAIGQLVYADRDVEVRAELFDSGSRADSIDIVLKAGWNLIATEVIAIRPSDDHWDDWPHVSYHLTTWDPDDLNWYWYRMPTNDSFPFSTRIDAYDGPDARVWQEWTEEYEESRLTSRGSAGVLTADGVLTLEFYGQSDGLIPAEDLLLPPATGNAHITNADVLVMKAGRLVVEVGSGWGFGDEIGEFRFGWGEDAARSGVLQTIGESQGQLIYADRDFSYSYLTPAGSSADAHFVAGWNVFVTELLSVDPETGQHVLHQSVVEPSEVGWYWIPVPDSEQRLSWH